MNAPRPRVRRGYLPAESEAAFQQKVLNLAGFNGWLAYHPPDNRPGRNGKVQARITRGFPDLTLVRAPRLIFAELKAEAGPVRPDQLVWMVQLQEVGAAVAKIVSEASAAIECGYVDKGGIPVVEAHIWRPSDWFEIERILGR